MDKCTKKMDKFYSFLYYNELVNNSIRDLSKKTNLSKSTIQNKLKELQKKGFIDKEKKIINSLYFKHEKTEYIIDKLYSSGVVDFLNEKNNPS